MRTLRRARPPHFSSDLTLRTLLRDRSDFGEDAIASLPAESIRRSLPEDPFDDPLSNESDFPSMSNASPMSLPSSNGLSSSGNKSVVRQRSLSPWHGETSQSSLVMKHKSLGAFAVTPRKYQDANEAATLAMKHRSLDNFSRDEFHKPPVPPRVGLRHRSMGAARERSVVQGQNRSSLTPTFLEGLAERVRSASPTPKSLSSDPEKIIASMSPRQGSFSLNESRLPSLLGSEAQSVPSVTTNSSVFGRSSRTASQIRTDFDIDIPKNQSTASLRPSTSLRRVLSLGRSRADSDLQSVVSEPVVYADSAHVADDIWIAPKDLYSVERRVALKQYQKAKSVDARVKDQQRMVAPKIATLPKVEKKESTSVTTTTESETPSEEEEEEEEEEEVEDEVVDDDKSGNMSARKIFMGPADVNHPESSLSNSDYPKSDPFEYGAKSDLQDMSSRLIRLFFSSGSQNPIPPSAMRAAEMRNNGSSRSLFWWRHSDRSRADLHRRDMAGNMATSPSMKGGNNFGYEVPPSEQVRDFDFRSKVREISKFANVRAWIRRRTYRRSQRRPERRPREAQT